jgi:anthranilate synthase component 1
MIHHKSVLADLLTPVSAFLRVAGESERAFLLESVEGSSYRGTFMDFRRAFPEMRSPHPDLPPFAGGAVGAFSYDMVGELERLPGPLSGVPREPSVQMDFFPTILAFDHLKHQVVIMSHESRDRVEEMEARLKQVSDLESRVAGFENGGGELSDQDLGRETVPVLEQTECNYTAERFQADVETAKEYIRAGDIFQVVLSQAFAVDFRQDPFNVYRVLRYINPSPYMFFLKQGDTCITGASPEMLVRVQGSELEYRPIAGTRRRGRTREDEARLEAELINDEKERAEHLMLVDLGRNDIGRVSEFGSVAVGRMMFLEKYSHVMHLVSSLKGRLRPELDRFDALAACFPAGTVTGAPKIRAMEIIQELEPSQRGFYAGSIGYVDYSGNLDTCIAIRTIVFQEGKAKFQAGAGIVADSIPELENLECQNKARVLFHALELARDL